MQRHEILQSFLGLYDEPSYLEIGVNQGHTFQNVKAKTKVAVDPDFLFDLNEASLKDPSAEFIVATSDIFFEEIMGDRKKFDVIFIDGLHTFDQVLRDILNSISCLNEGGVIVVDDVIPSDYAASVGDIPTMAEIRKAIGSPTFDWMGDVFKAVFFVESFLRTFSYATIRENHGQMVMWRSIKTDRVKRSPMPMEAVIGTEYKDVLLKKEYFNEAPFAEIFARVGSKLSTLPRRRQIGAMASV